MATMSQQPVVEWAEEIERLAKGTHLTLAELDEGARLLHPAGLDLDDFRRVVAACDSTRTSLKLVATLLNEIHFYRQSKGR